MQTLLLLVIHEPGGHNTCCFLTEHGLDPVFVVVRRFHLEDQLLSATVHEFVSRVAPSGGKWWRLKYRIAGVEKRLSLGTYPDTSLKAARDKRDEARALIAQGIDPSDVRKASKVQTQADEADAAREAAGLPPPDSFEQIAREWYETRKEDWSASYGQKIMRRLEVDVFPWLGAKPITSITPPMVLAVLRRVEGRGVVETAHRALENCGQVFRYAVATGRIVSDPARDL